MRDITYTYEFKLDGLKKKLYDSIIINTHFKYEHLEKPFLVESNSDYISNTIDLIIKAISFLKDGGLLFIYGAPVFLSDIAVELEKLSNEKYSFLFKYWIALENKSNSKKNVLETSHIGMLMYLKTDSLKNPTPFTFNFKDVRVPYINCAACKENIKDWGGKKHLMNPIGTALSDIWSDILPGIENCNIISVDFVNRIYNLINEGNSKLLVIRQKKRDIKLIHKFCKKRNISKIKEEVNKVINIDSIDYMNKIKKKYPHGIFDLAFADPPYNLSKEYNIYNDVLKEKKYVEWCNKWLKGMVDVIKPGGALLVLNIPKWSIYHAHFLIEYMDFQHWIVWNALSTPAGKLLPAHYALLYLTKKGGEIKKTLSHF